MPPLTHLPVLHEEDVQGVEGAEVEDVDVVLHRHLGRGGHGDISTRSDPQQGPKISPWRGGKRAGGAPTCRLLRGSIFMTEPTVLRGSEISTDWLGASGAWTCRGAAGARPKLGGGGGHGVRFGGGVRARGVLLPALGPPQLSSLHPDPLQEPNPFLLCPSWGNARWPPSPAPFSSRFLLIFGAPPLGATPGQSVGSPRRTNEDTPHPNCHRAPGNSFLRQLLRGFSLATITSVPSGREGSSGEAVPGGAATPTSPPPPPAAPRHPLPVAVELDGEVGHDLQGFVGQHQVHGDGAHLAAEGAGDLQPLGFHGREPHLGGEVESVWFYPKMNVSVSEASPGQPDSPIWEPRRSLTGSPHRR